MLRGYRFLTAAVGLALLVLSLGYGWMLGAKISHQEQRYQPYPNASDRAVEIAVPLQQAANVNPFNYRTPCNELDGQNENDLCVQWRAANAAEDGAFWTKWSALITIAGIAGLLTTIVQTRLALEMAREANELARDAVHTDRAWLMPEEVQTIIFSNGVVDGEPALNTLGFRVKWKNFGATPALAVGVVIGREISHPNGQIVSPVNLKCIESRPGMVGPNDSIWSSPIYLTDALAFDFRLGKLEIKITSDIVYSDIFTTKERATRCIRIARHQGGLAGSDPSMATMVEAIEFTSALGQYAT